MGKYRFKFSDMIPNAWFYKLKDMSKTRNTQHYKKQQQQQQQQQPHISLPRYSYYFTTEPNKTDNKFYNSPVNTKASDTHFPDPSRKSSKKKSAKRKTIYKPSPRHFSSSSSVSISAAGCNCHAAVASPTQSPDYYFISSTESSVDLDFPESPQSDSEEYEKFVVADSWSNSCNCEVTSDIIIDLNNDEECKNAGSGFDEISELELPLILTKPAKTTEFSKFRTKSRRSLSVKIVKEESIRTSQKEQRNGQRSSMNSTGIRLRASSPRIASKKIQAHANARKSISSSCRNKSLSESFVVVKSSVDPQKDFRDSMVEMILENNLRKSKDLEDLLACYLSLNSNEYHDHIIKAFEQVWFDMTTNLLRM